MTQRTGPLRGRRVLGGREGECQQLFGVLATPDSRAGTDGDGVICARPVDLVVAG